MWSYIWVFFFINLFLIIGVLYWSLSFISLLFIQLDKFLFLILFRNLLYTPFSYLVKYLFVLIHLYFKFLNLFIFQSIDLFAHPINCFLFVFTVLFNNFITLYLVLTVQLTTNNFAKLSDQKIYLELGTKDIPKIGVGHKLSNNLSLKC